MRGLFYYLLVTPGIAPSGHSAPFSSTALCSYLQEQSYRRCMSGVDPSSELVLVGLSEAPSCPADVPIGRVGEPSVVLKLSTGAPALSRYQLFHRRSFTYSCLLDLEC